MGSWFSQTTTTTTPVIQFPSGSGPSITTYSTYMQMMAGPIQNRYIVSQSDWSSIMADAVKNNVLTAPETYQNYLNYYNIYNLSEIPQNPPITTYNAYVSQTTARQLTCTEWSSVIADGIKNGHISGSGPTYDTYIKSTYSL